MHLLKKRLVVLAASILVGAASSAVHAANPLMSVNFNSPTYGDGSLNDGTVSQDGWLVSSGTTNLIPVSNSATNGLVSLTTSGQDVRRPFDGNSIVNTLSVYFTADINVSAAQSSGDYALHLGDGGASNFYARTYIKSSGTGYVMAEGTGSGTTGLVYGTTVLPFNTVQHILVRYDFISGSTTNDSGAIYINPTTADGTGDTPYVTATQEGTDATSIGAFYLRQGTASSAPTLTVDNVSVGTGLPEPGTIGLLGISGLGLLSRRRRR